MATKTTKKRASSKPAMPGPPNARRALEQSILQISRLLEEKSFAHAEEANAFLETLGGEGFLPGRMAAPSAREEAQELAYDAMEARTEAQARKLAKRALAKDPDCVDALVILSDIDSDSASKAIEGLQKAVTAGERSLGPQFLKQNKGHFWGILETRPYMRAKQKLAEELAAVGRFQEAIVQYQSMLQLNPNDNQGVRELLLGLYLQTGDVDGAGKLLRKYKGDGSLTFAWGRALERFLSGDPDGAAARLKVARRANPFLERFISTQVPMPDRIPEFYSIGTKEEAIVSLPSVAAAWTAHAEAMFWLLGQLLGTQPAPLRLTKPRAKELRAPKAPQKPLFLIR